MWTWPMSTPGSIGSGAIQHLVDEAVGLGVVLTAHVAYRPAVEASQRLRHLSVQFAHRRVLDLVFPFDLLDDQLGVANELDLIGAQRSRPLDSQQQRFVLGDVVGRPPDSLAMLLEYTSVGVLNDRGYRRRPGITASAAVDVDDDLHRRLNQKARRTDWRPASPKRSCPPFPTLAFQWRAERSSCSMSSPLAISKTLRRSSSRSTPH